MKNNYHFVDLHVNCDKCNKEHTEKVNVSMYVHEDYKGSTLKTFWCKFCKAPQVIRYKYAQKKIKIIQRIAPSDVFIPKEFPEDYFIKVDDIKEY